MHHCELMLICESKLLWKFLENGEDFVARYNKIIEVKVTTQYCSIVVSSTESFAKKLDSNILDCYCDSLCLATCFVIYSK